MALESPTLASLETQAVHVREKYNVRMESFSPHSCIDDDAKQTKGKDVLSFPRLLMAKEPDPSKNLCFLFFQRNFLEERRIPSLLPDSFIHFFRTTISRIVFSDVHSIVFPLSLSPYSTTINYDSGWRTGGLYHPWIRLLLEVRKGLEGGREKENREERRVVKINR